MKSILLSLAVAPLAAWSAVVPNLASPSNHAPFMVREAELDALDAPADATGDSFSLGEVLNEGYTGVDAITAMIKARAKFGGQLPEGLVRAVEKNPDLNGKFKSFIQQVGKVTGSVPAFPPKMFDVQYVVPVLIGTPPQSIFLNLDTGSSDLWTLSTDTYQAHINGQRLFDPRKSSTCKRLEGESWNVLYGDGAGASGIVYTDTVTVGGTYFDLQAVQSAVQVSEAISADTFSSGILGMANGGANTVRPTPQRTYIENISNQLVQPLFTVNLQKGRPGNYNFGYINKAEFQGPLQYTPINLESPFWEVVISGYQVGATGESRARPWRAVVDTGTTLVLIEDDIANDYYSQIPGAGFDEFIGMYVVPCNAQLPDFYFTIDSYKGRVPGNYINYSPATETKCYGGLQSNEGMDVSIIGDVLIKAQFVVFDLGREAVGFANKPTLA